MEVPDLGFFLMTVSAVSCFALCLSFTVSFRLEVAFERLPDLRSKALVARALVVEVVEIDNCLFRTIVRGLQLKFSEQE